MEKFNKFFVSKVMIFFSPGLLSECLNFSRCSHSQVKCLHEKVFLNHCLFSQVFIAHNIIVKILRTSSSIADFMNSSSCCESQKHQQNLIYQNLPSIFPNIVFIIIRIFSRLALSITGFK